MERDLTFCQCFFRRDTRKLIDKWMLNTNSSSVMPTLPTATFKHKTFFIWNLMVDLRSMTLASMLSLWVRRAGNLPALLLLGKLLHLFLVLVELLQIVSAHAGEALGLSLVAMLLVTQDAHCELRAGDMLQLDGARETLVLLGIVVLEADLEVHSFLELPLLGLQRVLEQLSNAVLQGILRDFRCHPS